MKTKKHKSLRLSATLAALAMTATLFSACGNTTDIKVAHFKTDGEFEYKYADWKATVAEVQESLPYSIAEAKELATDTADTYQTTENIKLNGENARAKFEFTKDDELRMIMFFLDVDKDNYKESFDEQYKKITKTFGDPTKEQKKGNGDAVYSWVTNDTRKLTLQVDSEEPLVVIGLADLTQFPDIQK